jgi:bacterioferritin-associated ferredoxin
MPRDAAGANRSTALTSATIDAESAAMLICQCNFISDRQVERAIRALLDEDPWQIVPAKVYRAPGERCKCAGCVPGVVAMIERISTEYRGSQ